MKQRDYPIQELKLEDLIKERDLASALGVSKSFLWTRRKQGMPHVKLGRQVTLYYIPDVVDWILSQTRREREEDATDSE
jgi:hypothetical protein